MAEFHTTCSGTEPYGHLAIDYGKLFEIDYINRNFKKIFSKGYPMPEDDFVSRSTVSSHEDSIGPVAIVFNDKILKFR